MPLGFPQPPISTATAHALTLFFASSYVGSLYVSKTTRLSFSLTAKPAQPGYERLRENNERWRDDPDVIRARLTAVSVATLLSCTVFFGTLWTLIGHTRYDFPVAVKATLLRLGLAPTFTREALYPHLITPLLFLGPLYAIYLGERLPFQRWFSWKRSVVNKFCSWQGARNYAVAPLTEEIVFRACALATYHMAGASRKRMIFLTPLSFGLAHAHHAYDVYNRFGRTRHAAQRALLMSIFQLTYTTLFGWHCSYLFLRTGSLFPPLSAHIFCNLMGVPELPDHLKQYRNRKYVILFMYVAGVVAFVYTLEPWTRMQGSMYWQGVPSY